MRISTAPHAWHTTFSPSIEMPTFCRQLGQLIQAKLVMADSRASRLAMIWRSSSDLIWPL